LIFDFFIKILSNNPENCAIIRRFAQNWAIETKVKNWRKFGISNIIFGGGDTFLGKSLENAFNPILVRLFDRR
jgi:hypothetical protein